MIDASPDALLKCCELFKTGLFDPGIGDGSTLSMGLIIQVNDTVYCGVSKGKLCGLVKLLPDGTFPLVAPLEYVSISPINGDIICNKHYYVKRGDGLIYEVNEGHRYVMGANVKSGEFEVMDYNSKAVEDNIDLTGCEIIDESATVVSVNPSKN